MTLLRLVATTLRLALPLYLLSLGLGLVGATVGLSGLAAVADRPWLGSLAGPDGLNVLVELGVSAFVAPPADRATLGLIGLEALLLTPLLVIVQWVGYTFLAGGILERLADGIQSLPGVFSHRRVWGSLDQSAWPGFWAASRRWFWPFVWLGVLGTFLFTVLVVLVAALLTLASRTIGLTASVVLLAAWIAVLLGWLELARASMVWQGSRSVGNALELATRVVIRPLVLPLWLFLALPGLGLLLASVNPLGGDGTSPVLAALVAFGWGQIVAFLGAWLKVIRLAAALRVVASASPD